MAEERFGGMIGPAKLLGLVENTAPWLLAAGPPSSPWGPILEDARTWHPVGTPSEAEFERYFVLCLAAHHTTVATYVPTDVDSKIRGLLWRGREPATVERMIARVFDWMTWDVDAVSARVVHTAHGPVSGLDGERLGVLMGALHATFHAGRSELAEAVVARIDAELAREAAALSELASAPGRELDALRLASILTHNAGDVDQGISFWPGSGPTGPFRERFGRLAHENVRPYRGTFHRAAEVYKQSLAPEGHRNYPLRGVRPLRQSRDLLLPISPFLDEWGALVATHPLLAPADRGEVLAALLSGCQKLGAQSGYYRAIAGLAHATSRGLESCAPHLPAALRRALADREVRRHVAMPRVSFESSMKKKAIALFGVRPGRPDRAPSR